MDVKEGDLVLLRPSGGMLTVIGVHDGQIEVAWSDGRHVYEHIYPRAALSRAELGALEPAPAATADLKH